MFDLLPSTVEVRKIVRCVWISQKYFTAHSINQDGNVSAWSLRSPPVPTQETPLDFSWAHMSIDPEANVQLKETRECGHA